MLIRYKREDRLLKRYDEVKRKKLSAPNTSQYSKNNTQDGNE